MSVEHIKALVRLGGGANSVTWNDVRDFSPKNKNDFSGVLLSRTTRHTAQVADEIDYEALSNIYIANDIAWTCIELISSTISLGKLRVRSVNDKHIQYLKNHPLQKLLDTPNIGLTQFEFLQSYAANQRLYGAAYFILHRKNRDVKCPQCKSLDACEHKFFFDTTSEIEYLVNIHPSRIIKTIKSIRGVPNVIYTYTDDDGCKYLVHPNNIIADEIYSPEPTWYGVSPTQLLTRWLDLDAAMTSQVTSFFENGAIPSMIVNLKPGNTFTYDEEPSTILQSMKDKWVETFSAKNRKGTKTPAFTYGDVTVERLENNIEDTIAKGLYFEIQNRVCATYGVPPTLYEMGLKYGSQRGNAEQGEKDFYNRTISKIIKRVTEKLNQVLIPAFNDPSLEIIMDLADMGIADFLLKEKRGEIRKNWEMGLVTRDETRMSLGLEPIGGEFGDDFYRLTVMSDGSNQSQSEGMDNRLKQPEIDTPTPLT